MATQTSLSEVLGSLLHLESGSRKSVCRVATGEQRRKRHVPQEGRLRTAHGRGVVAFALVERVAALIQGVNLAQA